MSVEKLAISGLEPAKIRFYYSVDELFEESSMRTNLRANVIKDEKTGETQEDDYAINESEKVILKEFFILGLKEISKKILKVISSSSDPLFIDATFQPTGAVAPIVASGVIVIDNAKYDDVVVNTMDNEIKSVLRHYILEQWYILCNMDKEVALYHALFVAGIKELSKIMLQLRKSLAS